MENVEMCPGDHLQIAWKGPVPFCNPENVVLKGTEGLLRGIQLPALVLHGTDTREKHK